MVKMVVFDLDGTLMNSLTDLAISVNYGLKLNGLEEKPVENYKTYVGNGREMLIRRAMGDAWTDHELFEKVKADYDRHYAVHCNDHTAAYDGCAEMLEKLAKKGVKTGVLSKAVTAESFAAAIKDILSDEKRLEKMKENCLENAKTFLDINSYCKKLLEIYSEVINNG